jgi:hypothetical protein
VFFGILEIYAREFQIKDGWNLSITLSYLKQKFQKTHKQLITNPLQTISNSGKWDITIEGDNVTIFIPKFKELMDESTIKKLRANEKSFRNRSGIVPKSEATDADADADKEIDKESFAPNGACPHRAIIALYEKTLPSLPRVKKWNETRQKHLAARWKEDTEQSNLKWWENFFEYIGKSKFLTGRVTGRDGHAFFASLDWIVKPENFAKIIEGKYE